MKAQIETLIHSAISQLQAAGTLPADLVPKIQIDRTKDKQHGDFASNVAMTLAKPAGKKPRELAEQIIAALPADAAIAKVEIAGPGFINFYLNDGGQYDVVGRILSEGMTNRDAGPALFREAAAVVRLDDAALAA